MIYFDMIFTAIILFLDLFGLFHGILFLLSVPESKKLLNKYLPKKREKHKITYYVIFALFVICLNCFCFMN